MLRDITRKIVLVFLTAATGCVTSNAEHAQSKSPEPPSFTAVIEPLHASQTSVLTVAPTDWKDANGETPTALYTWYVGGAPVANHPYSYLTGEYFRKGDRVFAELRSFGNARAGLPVTSNTVFIGNEAPVVRLKELKGPFFRDSQIKAETLLYDADGDVIRSQYHWRVNGDIVAESGDTLFDKFVKHDLVEVAVTAFDQENNTESSAPLPVKILNTPPTPPGVTLSPRLITTGTTKLWANIVTASTDIDGDPLTYAYTWVKDGAILPFPSSSTMVTDQVFALGEVWQVEVSSSDGEAETAPATSHPRLVYASNIDPEHPERPVIEKLSHSTAWYPETLTASGSGFSTEGILTLGGVPVATTSWNDNYVVFQTPNFKAGSLLLAIEAGGHASNEVSLRIRPRITALSAWEVSSATSLVLTGVHFGATQTNDDGAEIGGLAAEVTSWSGSQVTVTLPETLTAGHHPIVLKSGGEVSDPIFVDVSPWIINAPQPTFAGQTSYVAARWSAAADMAYLGELSVAISSPSPSGVSVSVPVNRVAGLTTLAIEANGLRSNSVVFPVRPFVSTLTPNRAPMHTTLTLLGAGLSPIANENMLTIGEQSAPVTGAANGRLWATLPSLEAGDYEVVLVTNGQTSNSIALTVTPGVVSVAPQAATGGTEVLLGGVGFGASPGSLFLDAAEITPDSWSENEVRFTIPTTLRAGRMALRVVANGISSEPFDFVIYPHLFSAKPAEENPASIIIRGQNLGDEQQSSSVYADGNVADSDVWSNTQIAFTPNLPAGSRRLSVLVNGIMSNHLQFEHARPWLDMRYPGSGTGGTSVTLSGRNFGAIQGTVSVAGLAATIEGWSDATVQIAIPAGVPKGRQHIQLADFEGRVSNTLPFTQLGGDVWVLHDGQDARMARDQSVWMGNEMFLWGDAQWGGTAVRYNPKTDSWTNVNMLGAPRFTSFLLWTGKEVLVYGGYQYHLSPPATFVEEGARYNPQSDTWTPMAKGGPTHAQQTAIWTGKEALFWSNDCGKSGAIYQPQTGTWNTLQLGLPPGTQHVVAGRDVFFAGNDCGGRKGYFRFDLDAHTVERIAGGPPDLYFTFFGWAGKEWLIFPYATAGAPLIWLYNPATRSWRTTPNVAQNVHAIETAWLDDKLVILTKTPISKAYYFYPSSTTWHVAPTTGIPIDTYQHDGFYSVRDGTQAWSNNGFFAWGAVDHYSKIEYDLISGWVVMRERGARFDIHTNTWTAIDSPRESAPMMAQHTSVWTGSHMLSWGGFESKNYEPERDYTTYAAQAGRYDPATDTWLPLSQTGAPSVRHGHTAVWTGNRMLVWGGHRGGAGLATGGSYDPASNSWSAISNLGAPSARGTHTANWSGEKMYIWGGHAFGEPVSTGAVYDPSADTWTPLPTEHAPAARYAHTTAWSGTELIVWGGTNGTASLATGARYSPATQLWHALPATGAPSARNAHKAVWANDRMLIWGGQPLTPEPGGIYHPATDEWTAMATLDAPRPRHEFSAVWTGARMLVWGGSGNDYRLCLNDGATYDPALDSWTPMTQEQAPRGRQFHSALWLGSRMMIWGGDMACVYQETSIDWNASSAGGIYYPAP